MFVENTSHKRAKCNTNNADLFSYRAAASLELSNYDAAIKDLDKAISLNPKNATYYYWRGVVKKTKGDYYGAIADYQQSLNISQNKNVSNALSKVRIELTKQKFENFKQNCEKDPFGSIPIYIALIWLVISLVLNLLPILQLKTFLVFLLPQRVLTHSD